MKNFCFRTYKSCLRSLGHCGILLSLVAVGSLYMGWSKGYQNEPMFVLVLIAFSISLPMCVSRLTPNWLADPSSLLKGLVILVGSGPLALLFGLVAICIVAPLGLDADAGKMLSMVIAFPAWALGLVMGWAALFYGILPDKGQSKPTSQSGDASTLIHPTTNAELRSLRQSRMTR